MPQPLRVLVVEDSVEDTELLLRDLKRGEYEPVHDRVDTAEAMREALSRGPWDLVISDYTMPRFDVLKALAILRETKHDIPFIIVCGSIGEASAVMAMKAGAHDYIMKGQTARLLPVIHRELREAAERRERKRAEDTILHLAYHDVLTDLPNRTLLRTRVQELLHTEGRGQRPLALLLIDLDRFKEVNDTLGHVRGDSLLQLVGRRIQRALEPGDILARLGGDEFALLLPTADAEVSKTVAKKILKSLEDPFLIDDLSLASGASIGIALHPEHGSDADTLLRHADVAMYVAKRSLHNYAFYSPEKDQYNPNRLALLADLRRAVDRQEFFLVYQPQVDLRTGLLCGMEALVRWHHPQRGILSPDQFVTLAERSGLIKPLTQNVLRQAMDQLSVWRRQGCKFPVAVNLSSRNLEDADLPREIAEILQVYGMSAGDLSLEITENFFLTESPEVQQVFQNLHEMGLKFTIDDFGTGFSSMSHLKKLPVSALKIDKSFVIDMDNQEQARLIVKSTIDLAHALSLHVIAEGVEKNEVLKKLKSYGCDAVQGFLISPPLPADEMTL